MTGLYQIIDFKNIVHIYLQGFISNFLTPSPPKKNNT